MNPLSSKNRKVSLFIVSICLLFYSFKSVLINGDDPFTALCKKSDAYYTYSYKDITYAKEWSGYKKYTSVTNKLVINTSKGVEDYAFLNLNEYESNHLQSIKVKTLKADGTKVKLDSSLVFKRTTKGKKFGEINYPIPAVEPGDTIEMNYVYYERLNKNDLKSYVSLYSDLPSLNTQYTIKTLPDVVLRYKSYNGFPEPAVISNDTLLYAQFSMNKVKGIKKNEFNCLPCEKPYLYYSIDKKGTKLRTWKDVYNEEFNFVTQPFALDYEKFSYYKRWKRKVIGKAKDSSKYYKFNLLHSEVINNFKMGPTRKEELIKSSGYFLKKKRFDPLSIKRFYRQILEDLEIEYWAVFGRTKRSGPISKHYIRKGEFDHIFFAFEDEKKELKLLYPHEDFYQYRIDEIPISIYNSDIILVKPYLTKKRRKKDKFISRNLKLAEADSVSIKTVKLPGMNANTNYLHQIVSAEVNVKLKKTSFKSIFKISGGVSTELRSFYGMLDKNKEVNDFYNALSEYQGVDNTIDIDTITSRTLSSKRPFTYKVRGRGTLKNAITFINDSLVSISLDKLINHNQLDNDTNSSELNYYLDYGYSDLMMFFLKFPNDIEILGEKTANLKLKNNLGEYSFELKKTKNNQLKIKSDYKILKDLIPKEKLIDVKLINEKVKEAKGKRFVIKLKKTKS
ncbi:DUF3857 domain-containing protein [Tenacibaculum jejuense]|uniref:DUF3857 domain-containing protein n=1 Tax=Tenacibaculum jejuense TaxID=584609 RepID=A0A238UEF4_9FLAO|nr:DUF3857 domain-containing protein [Tenacibaculum jejuense]SNR17541.1 conserved protein of unknown function [Tenacibaculum jejuense]